MTVFGGSGKGLLGLSPQSLSFELLYMDVRTTPRGGCFVIFYLNMFLEI